MDREWLERVFASPDLHPNRTGYGPCPAGPPGFGGRYGYDEHLDNENLNLGLGWLYYAIVRMHHVQSCVCIGSGRGFAPIVIAKGMQDNGGGVLYFIDPSFDDDFWLDGERVKRWFAGFGVEDTICHYLCTTEQFMATSEYENLKDLRLVVIDGCHFYEAVALDFAAFGGKLADDGILAFHDTISRSLNPKWQGPRRLIQEIEASGGFQIFDFRLGAGLTLVQKKAFVQTSNYLQWCASQWGDRDPYGF